MPLEGVRVRVIGRRQTLANDRFRPTALIQIGG